MTSAYRYETLDEQWVHDRLYITQIPEPLATFFDVGLFWKQLSF